MYSCSELELVSGKSRNTCVILFAIAEYSLPLIYTLN